MQATNTDIISKLQLDILRLQGYKEAVRNNALDVGLGEIVKSFPNATFPVGCVHEFLTDKKEDVAATYGFISGILNALTGENGAILWIGSSRNLFPPALKIFGIHPERFVFVDVNKEKDVLWVIDEALKCGALNAVVAEVRELSFMNSRRLQLAVEESNVTGFILRDNTRKIGTTTCVSRWKITSLPSNRIEDLPGISFPKWKVDLLRIRNGKPGSWNVSWQSNGFYVELQPSKFEVQPSIIKAG